MKKRVRLISLMYALLFLYGCAAVWLGVGAGTGIGTYKWYKGNLVRNYPLSYLKAWDITNTALANLKISITDSIDEGTKGTIKGMRSDGTKVIIKLKDIGPKVTSIGVRVGLLGNQKDAERIHDEITAIE